MKGGKQPGSGRPKGSEDRAWKARALVSSIFTRLEKEKGIDREQIAMNLLTCGQASVIAEVYKMLLAYEYGKPIQPTENSGPNGGPIAVQILSYMERPKRTSGDNDQRS